MNDRQSLVLSWKNISGWTKPTFKSPPKKKLLNNVCGTARSGCLTAIVSPSGGGKTTLLAILAGRYKGTVEGDLSINGRPVSGETTSHMSGFVCQKNHLYENLCVKEHLLFMARLKMNKNCSKDVVEKNVTNVLENLVLTHRVHVKLSSLSGGQVKRLALAVQLLTEPKILFCDEPTTGLDSYNAETVVKLLRKIANEGKMIVCAIHQPTSGIFEMFDDVSVLISNGSLAYHGPTTQVYGYFARLGLRCPENFNLCEFIVSRVTIRTQSAPTDVTENVREIENLVDKFYQSKWYSELAAYAESKDGSSIAFYKKYHHQVGFFSQLSWLLWRSSLLLSRSWKTWVLRFLLYFFVYTCLGFSFGHIKLDQTGVQNIQGFLNCVQMEIFYASIYGVVYVVPEHMTVFVQESADHVYSPIPFYLSHVLILTIKALFETFLYANLAFTITCMNITLLDYFINVIPVLLMSTTACAYGFFLSTAFESITTASLFSVPYELICNVFGGIFFRLSSLPVYLVWMKYLSFSYYSYEALSVNEWIKHNYIYCGKPDLRQCFLNGDQVLHAYGFSRKNLLIDYLGLTLYTLFLLSIGYLFLIRKLNIIAAY